MGGAVGGAMGGAVEGVVEVAGAAKLIINVFK